MLPAKMISTFSLMSLFVLALTTCPVSAEEQKEAPKVQQTAPAEQKKSSPTDTVAKVNGTKISRLDVDRAVKVLMSQSRITEPLGEDTMKEAEKAAMEQLISAELLFQAGEKMEIKDLGKMVQDKLAQNKAKFPTAEEFEKAMKSLDMSQKDMEEFTRKDIVINNLLEKTIVGKITVPDADVKKFYTDNMDKYFKKSETVKASHILIGIDEKTSPEEKKKAEEKAGNILKRIKAGEDFAELAKTESSCPSSAQGGDLGFFGKGQMVPTFEEAAFALKPGELSKVVETQFGYHIIKLTDRKEATEEKFDDVKEKIREFLKNQKAQKAVGDYINELKGKAKIERL
jgi:peptidyl-prolyl cis-trans isomerase C